MKKRRVLVTPPVLQIAALAALLGFALPATAQTRYADDDIAEWKEGQVPPPPAYSTKNLIDVELRSGSSVRMGVDPDTITVDKETGIVRYVAVARGPSAVNAMYEGIRCETGEYKVYARQTPGNDWAVSGESEWKSMRGQVSYPHPYRLARDGMCIGTAVNETPREIARALKSPKGTLYGQ